MKNNVLVLDSFKREYKRLSKKYKSLYSDVANLISSLELNSSQGVLVGANVRKIRMSISSKGKGKSGGARVITYTISVSEETGDVYLMTIYDKSERASISDNEINDLLTQNGLNE